MKAYLEYIAEIAIENDPVNTILSVAELVRSQAEHSGKVAKLNMISFLTMLRNAGLNIDFEGLTAYYEAEPNLKNKIQQFNDREIVFVAQGDEVDSETLGQPQGDIPPEEKVEKMAKRAMKARESVNEGYEGKIEALLADLGIDGYFRDDVLYVHPGQLDDAEDALIYADNIYEIPEIKSKTELNKPGRDKYDRVKPNAFGYGSYGPKRFAEEAVNEGIGEASGLVAVGAARRRAARTPSRAVSSARRAASADSSASMSRDRSHMSGQEIYDLLQLEKAAASATGYGRDMSHMDINQIYDARWAQEAAAAAVDDDPGMERDKTISLDPEFSKRVANQNKPELGEAEDPGNIGADGGSEYKVVEYTRGGPGQTYVTFRAMNMSHAETLYQQHYAKPNTALTNSGGMVIKVTEENTMSEEYNSELTSILDLAGVDNNKITEKNPDETISPDEEEDTNELYQYFSAALDDLISNANQEADRIGGGFRSPGITRELKNIAQTAIDALRSPGQAPDEPENPWKRHLDYDTEPAEEQPLWPKHRDGTGRLRK